MRSIAMAALLLITAMPALAEDDEPTPAERKTIADCLAANTGDEIKAMGACIGLVADPCPDAPGANTMTIVACQMREQKIWDGDAKCDYWEKLYEGGTFASIAAGNCMRATTGERAIEMRAILDELDH